MFKKYLSIGSKLLSKATNQKFLTTWYRESCPTRQELLRLRLRQAYHSLDTRLFFSSLSVFGLRSLFVIKWQYTYKTIILALMVESCARRANRKTMEENLERREGGGTLVITND
jgi:hypothetical protein